MPRTQTRAGDFTGTQKARLAKEHADEQAAAAATVAMATAAAAAEVQDTIDLEPRSEEVHVPVVHDLDSDVAVTDVDVAEEQVKFRVSETLEAVTIGYGNTYDFVEGQEYRAPKHIYNHLEEKGLIWH